MFLMCCQLLSLFFSSYIFLMCENVLGVLLSCLLVVIVVVIVVVVGGVVVVVIVLLF